MVLPGSDRRNRERLRRIERILENYERDRNRMEERIIQLRKEKNRLSGTGFPLLSLASALMNQKGQGGASVSKLARNILQGGKEKWPGNLTKLESELRKLHHKSSEISTYINQFQNTLNLMISGLSLVNGSGGGKILEAALTGAGTGADEREADGAIPATLEQVVGGDRDSEEGSAEGYGKGNGLNLEGLDLGALVEFARSPEFQAISKELIGKLSQS